MERKRDFLSPYTHGFVRVAVCVPQVTVADPLSNAVETIAAAEEASSNNAVLALFPELGLSAYSNEDLFHQDALLEESLEALARVVKASAAIRPVLVVGAPLRAEGRLYNCGIVIHEGRIIGATPKTFLPNYREFYEKRQFASGMTSIASEIELLGQTVPFGSGIVFQAAEPQTFCFHVEVCEDLWTPIPPSAFAALGGATVLLNLSASNATVGKADYRRTLAAAHSGQCVAAYLYSAAGFGESTTDLAWDGDALIYENGELLEQSKRFSSRGQVILADLDLELIVQERMRLTSFADSAALHREALKSLRTVRFQPKIPRGVPDLRRTVVRYPYVPHDPSRRTERCFDAYQIQVQGLVKRLKHTGIKKVVIGVSGGLDSSHALLIAAKSMDRLELSRKNILAYSLPGFGTSAATRRNALELATALGATVAEIDIRPSCRQMFQDIGHPFARGEKVYDVTFENVQAGERTSHLFRIANSQQALVVGTGDLSEIALGWSTYGVGDHMSHYNVNASIPKTFVRYLIRWVIDAHEFSSEAEAALRAVLATPISPELVPSDAGDGGEGQPTQRTEETIGPFDLQDFFLYHISRHGCRPSKAAFLALRAWGDRANGPWPQPMTGAEPQAEYDLATIKRWLRVFLFRFFQTSQFKRSTAVNGPKVGSGGSLSPRGDWRAPTDAEARVWLDELEANVPDRA